MLLLLLLPIPLKFYSYSYAYYVGVGVVVLVVLTEVLVAAVFATLFVEMICGRMYICLYSSSFLVHTQQINAHT